MDHLRGQVLFALSAGDVEQLAELLGELYRISFQIPNKQNARPLQYEPGIFCTQMHPTNNIRRTSRNFRPRPLVAVRFCLTPAEWQFIRWLAGQNIRNAL
jgi:hypothetical protein